MGRKKLGRTDRLQLLVSDEERRMVEAVADAQGVTVSDVIRQSIRRMYREVERRMINSTKKRGA